MRSWILAAMLLCAAGPALADPAPPPTPEDVTERVSADQNGRSVDLVEGGSLAVELQSSASTGASWSVTAKPDFITQAQVLHGPVSTPPANGRPLMGAPRWDVFLFEATATGSGEIVLEKRGPGAGPAGSALLDTFRVTVSVQ